MDGRPKHQWYLWGNPVFAGLQLIGAAFAEDDWDFHPDLHRDLDRLPMHTYVEYGETIIQPVCEAILTDQAVDRMLNNGLMPLLSESMATGRC